MNETLNETAGAAVIDTQAADVGTVGEQFPAITDAEREPVQHDASQPGIPIGEPTIIGMDLASGPDIAWPPIIEPTVGRKVWFFPNGCQFHSTPKCIREDIPMDADVVYVWGDRMVNLCVKDHIGQVHAFTSVPLVQPGDDTPEPGNAYATWMPYQVGQAKAAA